jgi:hypothetical protein
MFRTFFGKVTSPSLVLTATKVAHTIVCGFLSPGRCLGFRMERKPILSDGVHRNQV